MDRSVAPQINPIKSNTLIFPNRIELSEYVDLYWIDDVKDNTVKIDFLWDAGSKYQSGPLISSFCNQMLLSGNDEWHSNEISEEIDSLGGYVSMEHNFDHAGFTLFGLTHHIGKIFDIAQSAFNIAAFPDTEIDKLSKIKQKQFEHNLEKVNVNARRQFIEKTFGKNHPYGKLAELNDFTNIKRSDLINYYNQFYLSATPTLFLVGNVSQDFIESLKLWAQQFNLTKPTYPNYTFKQENGQFYTEKQDAIQTAIRIGRPVMKKRHQDYFHFQILNTVLGGYFGSRLMKNIREDKGYTYGIGSGIASLEEASYFFISTEVAKEKRIDTVKEIHYEINKLKTELIPDSELEKVKNYILGESLRNSDGAIAMMEKYKNIYFNNLSESYYTDFINSVRDCTAQQLRELANSYFGLSEFTEVSYG